MGPAVRRLLPYVLRYRRRLLLGLVCVVLSSTFQLLAPWVLKYAIDDLGRAVTRQKLITYAAAILAVACIRALFLFLMRRIIIGVSREIEYDLRNDFFARLQQMPLAYYQGRRTGDLMSRATNDLNAVRMMIGPAVMYSASTVLVFAVAIVLMWSIDGRLTLIALMPLPLVSISVKYFGSAIHRRFEAIQAQLSDLSAVVQETLSGVRVVRAYNQEPYEIERFRGANAEYVRRNRVLIRLQGMFYPSLTLFLGLGSLLVLWVGSREVIRGRITHRRVRGVQFVPGHAQLADDRVRLGDEHAPARDGVVEAHARCPRCGAGHQRRARDRRWPLGPAHRSDRDPGPGVHVSGRGPSGPQPCVASNRGRADRRARRRHGIREVDADQPAAAVARAASGNGVPRRRRRPRDPSRGASWRDRLRPAGAIPVLGHDRREHRLWRAAGAAGIDRSR